MNNDNPTILGANGMLGSAIVLYFKKKGYNVNALCRKDFDVLIDSTEKLKSLLINSSIVINCIGIIKQIIYTLPKTDVFIINGLFPRKLANLCKSLSIPLIHVSTDCVFSGLKGNYNENDETDARDNYGLSKRAGEFSECMVLRTSLIGPEINRQHSLLEWAIKQKNSDIQGYINHKWNGVTTLYFAEVTEKIWKNNLYKQGIYHIHSPDSVSKFELLGILNNVFNLNLKIFKYQTKEKCDRTLTSLYDYSKTLVTKTIYEQVKNLKTFFNL